MLWKNTILVFGTSIQNIQSQNVKWNNEIIVTIIKCLQGVHPDGSCSGAEEQVSYIFQHTPWAQTVGICKLLT